MTTTAGLAESDPPSSSSKPSPQANVSPLPDSPAAVVIPGPLRSFLRMAGISQTVPSEEVLPLLAREVFFLGYRGTTPTEFLILLNRYVSQARELSALAGSEAVIRVSNCAEAEQLLHILGYRIREKCGESNASLFTSEPERAFLTIDSGFPLTELEQTIQGGKPFVYEYSSTSVPVLFTEGDWTTIKSSKKLDSKNLIDRLLRDPDLALLYWALSRMDQDTVATLRTSPGLERLLPYAPLLNFYGSEICIRSGRVVVPGGSDAETAWKDLVGVSSEAQGEFVLRLLKKDRGWLVAFFDALSHTSQAQQAHFTNVRVLKPSYTAFRPSDDAVGAAKGVFRPAPSLLLLLTRLQFDPDGEVHVPGNVEIWKDILRQSPDSKKITKWAKGKNNDPQQLLEAMLSLCRVSTESGPVQAFLSLSELDAKRPPNHSLRPETVRLLASTFAQFSDQYLVFSEFPSLDDVSITQFVKVVESIDRIHNHILRGNAMGIFQADIGLWQILARQEQIRSADLNQSWQKMIAPFSNVSSSAVLFNAGRTSLEDVLRAATGEPNRSQDEILSLLAGPAQHDVEGQRVHAELADRMRSILDGQRLVSLDTLLALGRGLDEAARGETTPGTLVPLAGELREFEMPRPIFTSNERTEWAVGVYNNRHTDLEMKENVAKLLPGAHSKAQIEDIRGRLAPFLRDTLVGMNYAYYEPPGAQILRVNPLLVRSHDFSGDTVIGIEGVWQSPHMFGAGSPAGGGAHLIGSLADLPYVLAEVEQDFIAPDHIQALIWRELVPGLLTSSILPRWWDVSRNELHAVALYQRAGEELLRVSTENEGVRNRVLALLSDRMLPQRLGMVEREIREGRPDGAFSTVTPADMFYLTTEFRQKFPADFGSVGPVSQELESLSRLHPTQVSWTRLSRDFGTPHPILAQSCARELLNVKPFPALAGFSSRLMAESWDSTNLYWARLADEMNYPPVALNRVVPELTRRMVQRIFATDTEDFPAVLRAMQETGEEFRNGKIASVSMTSPSIP
ncbi:MAG: hypothetical protein ACHP8A_14830 [Terriglobales bacterium]|nr:hypothetical protein [Terriglobales bacterium]